MGVFHPIGTSVGGTRNRNTHWLMVKYHDTYCGIYNTLRCYYCHRCYSSMGGMSADVIGWEQTFNCGAAFGTRVQKAQLLLALQLLYPCTHCKLVSCVCFIWCRCDGAHAQNSFLEQNPSTSGFCVLGGKWQWLHRGLPHFGLRQALQ